MGKFVISKRANGDVQFNLHAANGQVILTSQGYASRPSCDNGIESVRKNAQDESRFVCKTAADGSAYFVLMATNGQVIGTSQMYSGDEACKKGMASVMHNAPDATIDDQTGS